MNEITRLAWDRLNRPASAIPASATLLAYVLDEICGVATPAQSSAFLRAVGKRVAADHAITDAGSNEAIFAAMNAAWTTLGWGHATIRFADRDVRIDHSDLPRPQFFTDASSGEERWDESVAAILCGVYDAWFTAIGGDAALSTQVVSASGGRVELRYGV